MRLVVRQGKWFAAATIGLIYLFLPPSSLHTIAWVGDKDLNVEFVVLDAGTGQPIPRAQVQIYNPHPSSLCGSEYCEEKFSRTADERGRITFFCRQCQCSGLQNWRRDTFAIHVPAWYIEVSSD